ncbi:NCS2 family permease [Acinetobacter pollinis]|uniref:NCS2 family permease n=1 Tax=Acinetobacter pollinis TaxID=2605270 RepID=UPI0018A31BD9|nr:NCS2 family permease [Acinetobacter pollinis]MBF7690759.1 NCS2 family permease [Acinetobacter pollinis]MBF7693672.1 NCS2 family permease [Acinetobacter pollinis]MBF7698363.1 NCS2 family permease [Acinetobacter pollinis]MBF7701282.1 NCS2 family permease [Acinetobacter pollinis]
MATPQPSAGLLERFFKLTENNTSVKTEAVAGITTFLTMCYIIIVNPLILSATGMDHGAVFVATCIAAATGCLVMGLLANYPIALAPGMGLNAYFAYSVCLGMHIPWQTALAAVFMSGIVFITISLVRVREIIVNAIPMSLKFAIGGGIGLFLALVALKNAGIIVANQATTVGLGDVKDPKALLAMLGLFLIVAMHHFRVRGAIIISILVVTAISTFMGLNQFKGIVGAIPSITPTLLQMDFSGLFSGTLIGVIFVFFLVDLFDSTGTLVGVAHRAGIIKDDGKIPRLKKVLMADSTAIVAGAALGTSSTTPYIESASGVAAGGRTGLTAVVVALLFLGCLFLSPLAQSVPSFATAPALLFVGVLMIQGITKIEWNDVTEAVPAFLTIVFMPFAYSIADGIAVGFISYAVIKLLTGKAASVHWMAWIIAGLWVLKFALFGG